MLNLQKFGGIAAGTIATLTGFRDYRKIDLVKDSFLLFCSDKNETYQNWMQAWNDFWVNIP